MMVESLGRLANKHLVLFVTMADAELEDLIAAPARRYRHARPLGHRRYACPAARAGARAPAAAGVDVIEAPWDKIGPQLIDRYFLIKNSEAIG